MEKELLLTKKMCVVQKRWDSVLVNGKSIEKVIFDNLIGLEECKDYAASIVISISVEAGEGLEVVRNDFEGYSLVSPEEPLGEYTEPLGVDELPPLPVENIEEVRADGTN